MNLNDQMRQVFRDNTAVPMEDILAAFARVSEAERRHDDPEGMDLEWHNINHDLAELCAKHQL